MVKHVVVYIAVFSENLYLGIASSLSFSFYESEINPEYMHPLTLGWHILDSTQSWTEYCRTRTGFCFQNL